MIRNNIAFTYGRYRIGSPSLLYHFYAFRLRIPTIFLASIIKIFCIKMLEEDLLSPGKVDSQFRIEGLQPV
jgi:hypothetical protein